MTEKIPEAKKLTKLEEDPELAIRVFTFINIFQELGVAYRSKMIHRRSAEGYYSYLILGYWKRVKFMVEWRRKTQERQTLYEDFQYLAEILEEKSVRNRAEKAISKRRAAKRPNNRLQGMRGRP